MMRVAVQREYTPLDSSVELGDMRESQGDGPSSGLSQEAYSFKLVSVSELCKGWRFGAFLGALVTLCALALNISITIWGSLRASKNGGHIYQGNCNTAERLNMAIHLVINVLSTLLLGASNYSMQCLCAPTRRDIDMAHNEGQWLDIGAWSLRNIKFINPLKRWVWLGLSLSSVPLHLLYNSMFYSSMVNHDYNLYFASEDWLNGAWYDSYYLPAGGIQYTFYDPGRGESGSEPAFYVSDPAEIQSDAMREPSQFDHLDPPSCVDAYSSSSYLTDRSNLILLANLLYNDSRIPDTYYKFIAPNSSLHWVTWAHDPARPLYNIRDPYGWMCDHWGEEIAGCDRAKVRSRAAAGNWTVYGYNVTGCVSQRVEELCSVNFNLVIGIVVIVVNLGKLVCIVTTCSLLADQPLITIGDAVASLLRTPDPSTKGCCLISRKEIEASWAESKRRETPPSPKQYLPQTSRLWKAAGRKNWISFLFFFCASLLVVLVLLIYAIIQLRAGYNQASLRSLLALGFGTATPSNLLSGPGWGLPLTGTSAVLSSVLVANVPQLLLSGLYLALNNLITRMQLSAEWASYSAHRKALRVSHGREGAQRSTYFLQLPYRLGLPLMAGSAVLHWLVSQSIFLASIDMWDALGRPDPDQSVATCGYSPLAMVCTLVVGALVVGAVLLLGARRLVSGGGMPLVGSCSVGIAAACHPPKGGDDALESLMWGAVPQGLLEERAATAGGEGEEELVGHCSFSSAATDAPVAGRIYI